MGSCSCMAVTVLTTRLKNAGAADAHHVSKFDERNCPAPPSNASSAIAAKYLFRRDVEKLDDLRHVDGVSPATRLHNEGGYHNEGRRHSQFESGPLPFLGCDTKLASQLMDCPLDCV